MRFLFAMLMLCSLTLKVGAQQILDLSGTWSVVAGQEHSSIVLPNTLDGANIGKENQLQPLLQKPQLLRLTRKHSYIGIATYQREVSIPQSLAGKPLQISLERVMWRSRLAIDGQDLGQMQESLVSPHIFYIEKGLSEGKHLLTLTIDNQQQHDISVDHLAHSYTNDTQIMWNGVLGEMKLCAAPLISEVQVYPDIDRHEIQIKVTGTADALFALDGNAVSPLKRDDGMYVLPVDDMRLWSEFSPHLYTLSVTAGGQTKTVSFGMRKFSAEGNRLLINGHPTFLRGTLECCVFPLTGTPPMDERGWMKVFTTAREYGLNHLRFHSWCPPEAAFRVADKMGFYCQVELPNWSLTVNKDTATARFLYDEFDHIVRHYGNHPSLCIISCGNELQPDFNFLNKLTHYMKSRDSRHLYLTSTFTFEKGHGVRQEPEDDIFVTQWTDKGWVRGQGVFDEHVPDFKSDYRVAAQDITVPLISHEIGQYSVYPNIREIEKYTGVLDPLNFKAIRDDLKRKGLLHRADDYLQASGRFAAILYKEEIERALKTPQQSGFQLLDLHDFPGQGTALVGLLDAFWDSKGLIQPQRFREFCAPVVPLAQFEKAVWSAQERFTATIDVADYSEAPKEREICWQLTDEAGDVYAEGSGRQVDVALDRVEKAQRLELLVTIKDSPWRNRWNIWVYPEVEMPQDRHLFVTADISQALRALKKGEKVLFSPKTATVKGLEGKFLPVFWSPVHFPKQAGTMGLLCNPEHPALSDFPTDMHSDWQWWNLVKRSRVMVLDSLPPMNPIVESVDNFVNNRRLALVFEAQVGKGRLIFSAIDLLTDSQLPEIRQLRYSLTRYMLSHEFHPTTTLTPTQLRCLLQEEGTEQKTGATSIYE
ncbi:MAG: glycoside hydrolase family 2 [Prevotella sp.]|nr:glycoside hydrolase family 2 [Prevotella sp.]